MSPTSQIPANTSGTPKLRLIAIDRSSLGKPSTPDERNEHDDKDDVVTAWLCQDRPFHGLGHVETPDRLLLRRSGGKSTPCSSMNVEKGSACESGNSAVGKGE